MSAQQLTAEQGEALDVARALAAAGVPVFVASPDPSKPVGFRLPSGWQLTRPDPAVVDSWRPGMALCAVMGHGLDLVDIDPRNGGDAGSLNGTMPTSYAVAATPSGGVHSFVRSLGVRSRDDVLPGIDVKAGDPEGNGRGFAFIAPTVKASKVTGELVAYRWLKAPDLDQLAAGADDRSGEQLADTVRAAHRGAGTRNGSVPGQDRPPVDPAALIRYGVPIGSQDNELSRLVMKLRANGYDRDTAAAVWTTVVDRSPTDAAHPWADADFERHWSGADRKVSAAALADIEQWRSLGVSTPPAAAPRTPVRDLSRTGVAEAPDDGDEAPTDGRQPLDVSNPAVAADWLRGQLGAGPLSGMFARGDGIVHAPRVGEDGYVPLTKSEDNHDGPAQVRGVTADVLAARLQYSYACLKLDGRTKRWKPGMFPTEAARTAVNAADMLPNLRRLAGVTHTPIVRADGTVLTEPGYDEGSRLLYLPDPDLDVPPVPDRPTAEQVAAAVALLDEMTAGFPFLTVHDRANYYAALLSPLLRQLVPPPYKLIGIGARERGSGKSLLASINRILHGGVIRSEMPEDDAELRKQITTILDITTAPVVEFDNVSGTLRSSVLAGLLTARHWDDRRLGGNTLVSRPNDRLWTITGNNLQLGGDLVRRTLWVTIDPGVPNPERRTGFAITNLEAWVTERRGQLLNALLTMVRAWVVAGSPPAATRGSDGFARWIESVGGILAHAGVPGVVDHEESAQQTLGVDDDEWETFLAAAHLVFGDASWTTKELLEKVDARAYPDVPGGLEYPQQQQWRAAHPIALDELPGALVEKVNRAGAPTAVARALGVWLRNREGRWAGGRCARSKLDTHAKSKRWRIQIAGSAGSAGSDYAPRGVDVSHSVGESPEHSRQLPALPAPAPGDDDGGLGPSSRALLDQITAGRADGGAQ